MILLNVGIEIKIIKDYFFLILRIKVLGEYFCIIYKNDKKINLNILEIFVVFKIFKVRWFKY